MGRGKYSKLRLGNTYKLIYFDIDVLERYVRNPDYIIMDYGFRGSVYTTTDNNERGNEIIRNFGLSRSTKNPNLRAVGVFVLDLASLPLYAQEFWSSHELKNQSDWEVNNSFITNLKYGEFVDEIWVLDAILEEMSLINKILVNNNLPKIFSKTIDTHTMSKPDGYRGILLPTLHNYHNFIMVFEKLVINNISSKLFKIDNSNIVAVESSAVSGSLNMLYRWISLNSDLSDGEVDIIIKPLRELRSIRQNPAHRITKNYKDNIFYEKQNKITSEVHLSLRSIRVILYNLLNNDNIAISSYLDRVDLIVCY